MTGVCVTWDYSEFYPSVLYYKRTDLTQRACHFAGVFLQQAFFFSLLMLQDHILVAEPHNFAYNIFIRNLLIHIFMWQHLRKENEWFKNCKMKEICPHVPFYTPMEMNMVK